MRLPHAMFTPRACGRSSDGGAHILEQPPNKIIRRSARYSGRTTLRCGPMIIGADRLGHGGYSGTPCREVGTRTVHGRALTSPMGRPKLGECLQAQCRERFTGQPEAWWRSSRAGRF